MKKIVVNIMYGTSFSLTAEEMKYVGYEPKCEIDGYEDCPRDNPLLIEYLETHCDDQLGIIEIPDDVDWEIDYDDGVEHVAEKHREWFWEPYRKE